jgi:hypothetical protein
MAGPLALQQLHQEHTTTHCHPCYAGEVSAGSLMGEVTLVLHR